nr:ribonuclease H-like domain-containing protein [Tanacetum cinerariifolium]
ILNGDSPAPTRVVGGVLQPVAPTTAEQRLARKNEIKARGTLLMALPDKHQLKFNSHKDAKTLMEAIKKSNTKPVSAAASVSAVGAKIHVSSLPNVDSLSNRTGMNLGANRPTSMSFDMSNVECYNSHRKGHFTWECRSPKDTRRNSTAEPQRRNSFQAEEEPTNYALMAFSSSSSSSDNELRDNALVSLRQNLEKAKQERDDLKLKLEKFQTSFKNLTELLSSQTNAKTGVMKVCPSPIYDRCQLGNGYHVVPPPYTGTFMPPKPDLVFNNAPNDVETYHPGFNVKLSPTKPDQNLSYTNRPSAPITEDWVSDLEDESQTKTPQNVLSFVLSTKQVKSPRPSVQHVETFIPAVTPKSASPKTTSNVNHRNRKACFVCKILTQSKPVPITVVRPVTTVVPQIKVNRPRQHKPIVTKHNSPTKRHINRSPSPKSSNSPPIVTAVKAPMVNAAKGMQGKWEWKPKCPILDHSNPQHALKDNGVIDSGCSRHMSGNMSHLSDFEELNGGYVAFGGNPKGGKIFEKGKTTTGKLDFDDVYFVKELKFNLFSVSQMCDKKNSILFTDTKCLVLSPEFKLRDANQVLLRVPRENNMYNVNLMNIVSSRDLTCLFSKATLDESNLWPRRLGHFIQNHE